MENNKYMNKKSRKTQGQKKLNQLFNDIKRNKTFLDVYEKVKDTFEAHLKDRMEILSEGDDDRAPDHDIHHGTYSSLRQLSYESKRFDISIKYLSKKYSINLDMLSYLIAEYVLEQDPSLSSLYKLKLDRPDMCRVLRRHYSSRSRGTINGYQKEYDCKAFPVELDIHAYATKRDVLDFINKRWEEVQDHLSLDRSKSIRIRKRSIPIEMTDYIWENRNLSRKEINNKVKTKFPGYNFGYEGIAKIISLEKKRRTGKLP